MKHITLLALMKDRDQALEELRELGSVEVTPVQAPSGGSLEEARERHARAESALQGISTLEEQAESPPIQAADDDVNADQVIDEATELLKRRTDLVESSQTLQNELERLAPLGDFDVEAITKLAENGVTVNVVQAAAGERLVAPPGFGLQPIAAATDTTIYALYGRGQIEPDVDLGAPYVPFTLPDHSPPEMRHLLQETDEALAGVTARLVGLSVHRSLLSRRAAEIAEDVRYLEVREGMGAAEGVCYLEGYAPEDSIAALRASAGRFGWGLLVRSPRPGEQVPTLIHYPKIVRPIKTLFGFLRILPGYWEADVSWTVLAFFTLFVGLLIGDACYGLLMVALAIVLFIKARGARNAAVLLLMLGISVVFFGAVSGSWLGIKNLPPFLAALKIDWLADNQNVMNLSFFIGAVHLSIAHVWNSIVEFPRTTFLAQIGWLLIVWAMYFLASSIVLGNSLPSFEFYLLGAGIFLVIAFMTPPSELKGNLMNHFLLPLTLVSFFTDIISYVRLFAVGVATVAVMDAFNGMAMSIGFGNVLTGAAAVLILLFGHSLNLVLAALAVLVHAVRLNTLEFSTHKGLSWSGRTFRPFARSVSTAESSAQMKG